MRFIQINLSHCEGAQDLLLQTVYEPQVDVAIVCEPYRDLYSGICVADSTKKAAIWACGNKPLQGIMGDEVVGFTRTKINGIYVFSCYAAPRATLAAYENMLDGLVMDARGYNPKVIAGDFNAWAVDWGSRTTNARKRILLEAFTQLDMVLANDDKAAREGNTP